MDREEIASKVKEMIADVGDLEAESIGSSDDFVEDLQLDSLALLELGVDVDYEFKLGLPDERLQQLRTVNETVELVLEHLGQAREVA